MQAEACHSHRSLRFKGMAGIAVAIRAHVQPGEVTLVQVEHFAASQVWPAGLQATFLL